ncbi:MAG: acyl carrier protein [Coriobacteriales bacterium]|nr:acyl carrier protein [Coriobacteriales bacterium]
MERAEALKRLAKVMNENTGIDESRISEEVKFTDLDFDSLDMLQLVVGLEEEFDATIPDEKLAKIYTVSDALDIIQETV